MKGKKVACAALCFGLLTSLVACNNTEQGEVKQGDYSKFGYHDTGYPIVDKPLTLKAVALKNALHGDWDKTYWNEYAEKKTGIKLEFEYIDKSAWAQKKQLMFAGGNLPDVFIGGYEGISKADEMTYGADGFLVPLNDLIEKYAPDITQMFKNAPSVKAETTAPDGNIYTLASAKKVPEVSGGLRVWMNEQWLSNLNVQRPTNIEEFHKVLYQFRDADPDGNGKKDTYAISGVYNNNEGDLKEYIMCAYGIWDDDLYVKNGKVVFGALQPGFKEYLKEMNFLYSEGLIDDAYFTQTMEQYKAKSSTGKVGVGVWSAPSAGGGMDKAMADQYSWTSALTSDYNDVEMWPGHPEKACSTGHFAITKNCKYPEAAIRWANLWYTEEGGIVTTIGPEYGTYDKMPKYGYELLDNGEWITRNDSPEKDNWTAFNRWIGPAADGCAFGLKPEFVAKKRGATEGKFNEALASNDSFYEKGKAAGICGLPSNFYFEKEEQENIALVLTEARAYLQQLQAKFITGAEPIENYDLFTKKLKGYGLEKVIKKYQAAYDNYMKNLK